MSKGFCGGSMVKNPPAMQEMQETWVQSLGREDSLEKEMATHSGSSILAWKIPWTEGLQYMGLPKSWTQLSMHAHLSCEVLGFSLWLTLNSQ